MKHIKIIILFLAQICSFYHSNCYAFSNREMRFLTMQDGLADNTINCIHKDKDGFMWFGTDNGLSRYDGVAVRNFSIPSYPYTHVRAIDELSEQCLGIMIKETLYGFNRLTEEFIPIEYDINDERIVQCILTEHDQCYLITTKHLYICSIHEQRNNRKQTISIVLYTQEKIDISTEKHEYITCSCISSDSQHIYLTTNHARLFIWDKQSRVTNPPVSLPIHHSASIRNISDYMGILWISTIADGIFRYHTSSKTIDHISYDRQKNTLSHTDVYDIIPINNNRLLAVTWNGYTILSSEDKTFNQISTEVYNNTSFINQNIEIRMICAYYDQQGILWIGTHGGGSMCLDLRLQFFHQFHQERHNEICGIAMDEEKYIWLATYHKGIMKSNTPFHSQEPLEFETLINENIKETVLCLFQDKEKNLWFGNQDGTLTSYDRRNGFKQYKLVTDGHINTFPVWALHIDKQKRCWIGTERGILLFDPTTKKCQRLPIQNAISTNTEPSVRAIAEAHDGTIWIGTEGNGIGRITGNGSVHLEYNSIHQKQHTSVRSLLSSSDGFLYIGYKTGLGLMNIQTQRIEHIYTTQNGLCNNFIGCLAEDSQGKIWIGSNSGISQYSRQQQSFYHYYISGSNRSVLSNDSTLFWGNNKTLTYFIPNQINTFSSSDKVAITTLEIGNKTIHTEEEINGQIILHNNIFQTDQIELSHNNRDFSLTFSSLSYSKGWQKMRYRLYPYQEKWIITDKNEKVSYTNLRTGEYTFEIQNLYPDEHMGKITTLSIVILPHWSETLAFKLFLITLFITASIFFYRKTKLRQKRLEHEMQLRHEVFTANLERDKEKQMRIERETFFTNAAHELRTPLTLILSPLQELLQKTPVSEPVYAKLLSIKRIGDALHQLVDQLLYVQKIEAGMIRLSPTKANITALVKSIADNFRPMAEAEHIEFETKYDTDDLVLWIDVRKITSTIENLLSNAFKYTSPNGKVTLKMSRTKIDEHYFCRLDVSDTGAGIPEELQKHIFESYITGNTPPLVSTQMGVGLRIIKNTMDLHHGSISIKSVLKEGSTFTIFIPEGNIHFIEDHPEINKEAPEDQETKQVPEIPQSQQKYPQKLLIIEDHPEMRKYICSLFTDKYTIYEAPNGEVGVQLATEQLPHLIISDVMMPVKDGFTCCKEIKESPYTAHIPILMLTAKAEDTDMLHASRIGVDDYMMKPFNPEMLQSKVENLIIQRERLKRIYSKTLMLEQPTNTCQTEEQANNTTYFMQQVIQVVEANISNEDFNVKMLADQLNMSQPTLYRHIKQYSPLTAIEIIRSIRMSKAAALIMENRYSMQEIAEKIGYNDTRTLRKHFINQFGVPPSKYMNKE